jgi:DNA-binding MarR family transcriptional regulator
VSAADHHGPRSGSRGDALAAAATVARVVAAWRAPLGLSANQAEVLLQVYDGGAVSAAHLTRVVGITSASMSRLLGVLEEGGWILRAPHPDDARASVVQPTKRLVLVLEQLEQRLEASVRASWRPGAAASASSAL